MAQTINLGPYQGGPLQQMSTRHMHMQALQRAGATFTDNPTQAHRTADAAGKVVYYLPPAAGGPGPSNLPMYAVADAGLLPAGAGGGSSSSGTTSSSGAPGPVQVGLPGFGPRGPRFRVGAQTVRDFVPSGDRDYNGLDTFNPPTKIGLDKSPDAVNCDDFASIGARCNRRGVAKFSDDVGTAVDAEVDESTITVVAHASLTAGSDYFTITDPDGDTHAFWYDTTGSDSEPGGSSSADNSYRILITSGTASDVAIATRNAINASPLELTATQDAVNTDEVDLASYGPIGYAISENVSNAGFTVSTFSDSGGASLHADYRGFSLARIPGDPDQLLVVYADEAVSIGDSLVPGGNEATSMHIVSPVIEWGDPALIADAPPPALSLSEQAGPLIRAVTSYSPGAIPRGLGTRALIVRYSTTAFPQDPYGHDDDDDSVLLVDSASWDGSSRQDDTGVLAVGTYWFSAWVVGVDGLSRPAHERIVLT